ncbi:MAG: hypothetical protein IJF47_03960 [Candidatus Methanomethylophilaceae archaeon]|nr:hypothetical protein [Thermoplasmata archaeon]MBQ2762854.1 hypothetical protein [Candidatus Methanomethylophilaceae archaeon]
MENKAENIDLMAMVIDTHKFVADFNEVKIRNLIVELDMLLEDFEREVSIMYLSGNYSSNKHLCTTVLRGKTDDEIKGAMATARAVLVEEAKKRKNSPL